MLAHYVRFSLAVEFVAYLAIAQWLHFLYGWSYAPLAAGAVASVLASRLVVVCITTTIGYVAGSPRPAQYHVGAAGAAAMILREWRVVLMNNFFRLPWERLALRPDPQPRPAAGVPVVLVHGYFSNRGYFAFLVRALEARGVAPVFAPNFRAAFATIEQFAEELHREIERIAAASAQPKMVLICHSMGGLAARTYLCAHGSARVAKLVTVASPHHGTVHARFGAGANARQMHPGSAFLAGLCEREAERAPECGVTSIYSPHDNLVAPQETSRLEWAKNVVLPGLGHLDILNSERLAAALVEELRECGVAAGS
jgi:predicted alpha/beta hydrolase family esterase